MNQPPKCKFMSEFNSHSENNNISLSDDPPELENEVNFVFENADVHILSDPPVLIPVIGTNLATQNVDVPALRNISEPKLMDKVNSILKNADISELDVPPVLHYFGDMELESLKNEFVDLDKIDDKKLISPENVSTLEVNEIADPEFNNAIENVEMNTTEDESNSSGVGSNTDSRSNDSSESVIVMFSENNMAGKNYSNVVESSNYQRNDAEKGKEINFEGKPKPENLTMKEANHNVGTVIMDESKNPAYAFSVKDISSKTFSDMVEYLSNEQISETTTNDINDGHLTKTLSMHETNIVSTVEKKQDMAFPQINGRITAKIPYKNCSNPFEVVVPLIGKNVMSFGHIKPFNHRYDLARERNRQRFKNNNCYVPDMSFHDWRKQRDSRSKEEKEREEELEQITGMRVAAHITKLSIKILQEMQKDEPDQDYIARYFERLLHVPISTLSLMYVPQFVHTVMYCRGSTDFNLKVRRMAHECYLKCHVMFPIPDGYNFETVYTSEVKKNLPDFYDGMHEYLLEYDDFDSPSDSEDSAFSDDSNAVGN